MVKAYFYLSDEQQVGDFIFLNPRLFYVNVSKLLN
jgi:hypothetical protein